MSASRGAARNLGLLAALALLAAGCGGGDEKADGKKPAAKKPPAELAWQYRQVRLAEPCRTADLLRQTEAAHVGCQIGSYPFWRDGRTGANFVIRAVNANELAACTRALVEGLEAIDRPAIPGGI